MFDCGTPPKSYHLKRIICCIDEMEVSPLVPDPEAVALPTHADGEVAPWQSHLHKPPVDNSQVKKCDIQPSLVFCPQFCHILPRTGPLTSSIPNVHRASCMPDTLKVYELSHLALGHLDSKDRFRVNLVEAALAGTLPPIQHHHLMDVYFVCLRM